MPELPSRQTMSPLGVMLLPRYFERLRLTRSGAAAPTTNEEWVLTKIMFSALNLPIDETIRFVHQDCDSLADLERRIIELNGGAVDAAAVARFNAVVRGDAPADSLAQAAEESPVLGAGELNFWRENGYVIVRRAIARELADAATAAVYESLGAKPDEPDTWYGRPLAQGIFTHEYHLPELREIRRAPRIRSAFAQLWGTSELWPSIDRAGFNPPERPGVHHFGATPLHWDASLAPPREFGTQGILYLSDVAADQGAFTCVPGFHRRLDDWLASLPPDADPRAAAAGLESAPVAAEAGDLIIWHQLLPHAASANRAASPRVAFYLNMFANRRDDNEIWK